jgi:hypothetical protein
MFEACGAIVIPLYCLKWQRPLRPARHALRWLRARGTSGLVTWGLRPAAAVADTALARWGPARSRTVHNGYAVEDLPVDVLVSLLPELLAERALRPEYEAAWLEWFFAVARHSGSQGVLRRRLVRDADQKPAGWFVYFVERGGDAQILQLVARRDAPAAVFDALLGDAWSAGAALLSGPLEPSMVPEMSARHCYFRQGDHWTLAHTKDPDILATIMGGNAFLSRLEGEW